MSYVSLKYYQVDRTQSNMAEIYYDKLLGEGSFGQSFGNYTLCGSLSTSLL